MHNNTIKKILSIALCIISIFMIYFDFSKSSNDFYPEWTNSIAFVLDVSQSMNVSDTRDQSRLQTAKEYIISLMQNNMWYDFSLAIFAWESQRVIPFTQDIDLFATLISGIDSKNILKQWSNIESWLIDAFNSFSPERTWKIIVLTDWDDSEIKINSEIVKEIKKQWIEILIVWVWSLNGGYIPSGNSFNPYKVYNWQRVIAKLNEEWLKRFTNKIGWTYKFYLDHESWNVLDTNYQSKTLWLFFYIFCVLWIIFIFIHIKEMYIKTSINK